MGQSGGTVEMPTNERRKMCGGDSECVAWALERLRRETRFHSIKPALLSLNMWGKAINYSLSATPQSYHKMNISVLSVGPLEPLLLRRDASTPSCFRVVLCGHVRIPVAVAQIGKSGALVGARPQEGFERVGCRHGPLADEALAHVRGGRAGNGHSSLK